MTNFHEFKSMGLPVRQRGAILVVSLIMLLVMTVLGVSSMDTTSLEMKMASNNRDRQVALQAAEAALTTAELFVQNNGFTTDELQPDDCGAGNNCFETTCTNGRCFHGTYDSGDTHFDCVLSPPAIDVWEDPALDVWDDAGKHQTVAITGLSNDAKYIIEFMCYVGDGITPFGPGVSGAQLYRISALGTGETGRSQVLLQSIYRKI